MPPADTRSRALFTRLKTTLSDAIGNIYEQELALRRKPGKTAEDQAMISALFQKRAELQDLIPVLREAEIAYLASPMAPDRARAVLHDAARQTHTLTERLQRIADTPQNATLIVGTIRDLVGTVREGQP